MKNKHASYSVPADFDPFSTDDRARALVNALYELVTEGEMTARPAPQRAYTILVSLRELLQPEMHALHDYLREIENRTDLRLPLRDADFSAIAVDRNQVREERAPYFV